ncbi:MAG: hypothetical protein J1E39_06070 [Eubacterium sp.]|nr:hypothetical protein [Eubacterium sp.]
MNKIKRKILAVLLTAAMLVSVSPMVAWSDEAPVEDEGAAEVTTEETGDDAEKDEDTDGAEDEEDAVVDLTDEEGLAKMKQYAETDQFRLFVNEEDTTYAIQSKTDDYVWWSAPLNLENDSIAKPAQRNNMKSPLYILYGNIEQHTSTRLSAVEGSINGKDFELTKIDNGFKVVYNFSRVGMSVPMTVTLDGDHLNVQVLLDEVVEPETTDSAGYVLLDVGMGQFFAAGGIDDDGFMMVPDGSGAIINFNNNSTATAYSNDIYGADTSITQLTRPYKTEQVYLPVIGNVVEGEENDHGFIAVAVQGDTFGSVNATVSRQSATEYNNVWFEFKIRAEDTYYMGDRRLQVFENGNNMEQPNISVNIYPLIGENLSYVDMANRYRKYLMDEKGFTEKSDNIDSYYYLDLYGGTVKAQSVLGFPVNMETPATTYSQAKDILSRLKNLGVENIIVNYNDFNGAGINGLISASVNHAGTLGGKGDFDDLMKYAEEEGITISPSVGITYMKGSGNGYSYSLNACKQITNAYATTTNWDIAFGIPHQVRQVVKTTLAPYYWTDLYPKLVKSFNAEGIKAINLSDATTLLYSDFSRGVYTRYDTMNELIKGYQTFKDNGMTLVASGANAYALPYVDYLTDVPLSSSNFDLFDYDIPFYELVIHGYIPYTTKAINASADASDLIMLALSTATPVHYDMMYSDPNDFTDSDYDELFYSNYSGWITPSTSAYQMIKDTLDDLVGQKIVNYEKPSKYVIHTTYEDGTVVSVNTRQYTMTIGDKEYSLADYGLKGETVSE